MNAPIEMALSLQRSPAAGFTKDRGKRYETGQRDVNKVESVQIGGN